MTESEFKQLQEAEQEEQQERAAAAAAADGSSEQQEQQQEEAVHLNLGRDMLEDEFGELCGAVLLQVSTMANCAGCQETQNARST